jgi:hypothetical protein
MKQCELVEGMGEFGCGVFSAPLEPLDTLLGALGEAEFTVELGNPQTVHGTGVEGSGGFAEKLDCLGRFPAAAPAVLAACTCTVGGIGVTMFGGQNEERISFIEVLFSFHGSDAIGAAVSQEVLAGGVASVSEALEEGGGFPDEIITFFESPLHDQEISRGVGRDGKRFGGVDHEYRELELEIGILGFLGIGAIELEGAFVREEGGLFAGAEVGVVEERAVGGRGGGTDGLGGDGAGVGEGQMGRDGLETGGGGLAVGAGGGEKVVVVVVVRGGEAGEGGGQVGVPGLVRRGGEGGLHGGGGRREVAGWPGTPGMDSSLRTRRPSEASRKPPTRSPSKLSKAAPRDVRKSRVDDKIKKRMSMRYADISPPTSIPPVPVVPPLPAPSPVSSHPPRDTPRPDDKPLRGAISSDDKKLLSAEDFDPDACTSSTFQPPAPP